ncbi:16S rRNA methyltransferase [Sulfurifustis variabilis]|uniref:16S rRNA (cytosine(967)-C(5))-methyltransferase n=1 Tax=Sulfurifustis variabilis TaxID=1675686 RepID=A0A1B4V2E2_9GAMM|nr:16S rRNA methyltransferase [Sulfurifustis variabilis]
MSGTANPRAAAARVIFQVTEERRYLDAALDEVTGATAQVDRPLVQELAYGTLRWYQQLDGIAHLFLARPLKARDRDVHALILVGLYQLRHLRVPAHAAVDQTVEATAALGKSWAKGLVNACLRASLREANRVAAAVSASDEMRFSHPAWLIARLRADYPRDWQRILEAGNARPPMALRVNLGRLSREDYLALLERQGALAHAHAASDAALVLDKPLPVDRLPGFSEGLVSVQDVAAQIAAALLDAQNGERVLDACAAPGGKAAHILERAPEVELLALDIDPGRLARTRAGLDRLGLAARLLAADASKPTEWWDGRLFDRALVDAPCSATGVIRRHPDIKVRRRPDDLPKLTETQAGILEAVWPCLRPGGKLLYVTCSVLGEENEQQMRGFLRRHADAMPEPAGCAGARIGRQILPGEDEMDGFYYACLLKR